MSEALRNSLWNVLLQLYEDRDHRYWQRVAEHLATLFRKVPADQLPYRDHELRQWVKEYFYSLTWYEAYDLIEFVVHNHHDMTVVFYGQSILPHRVSTAHLAAAINGVLERELSGFRLIQGSLVPISDPAEVQEIEDAAESAGHAGLVGAREHIRTAVELLGKKPHPDYRNAIKEAISAVESVAKQIGGADTETLDPALRKLAEKVQIHGALRAGFSKLYGFTSDQGGIRHAILDEPSVGFAEAKYMIVSCSAFVNYLIVKSEQGGLLK